VRGGARGAASGATSSGVTSSGANSGVNFGATSSGATSSDAMSGTRDPDAPTGAERWLASLRVSGFTLLMLVLIVVAIVVLAPSLKLVVEQHNQIADLERAVADKKHEVTTLQSQVARWDDPAYIEAQARDRLLFVYPGDYSYLVIDDATTSTTKDGAPISSRIQTTQVDWMKSLLSSVLTAGLSDAAPDKLVSPVIGGTK
jgi:cell division protein FtsB